METYGKIIKEAKEIPQVELQPVIVGGKETKYVAVMETKSKDTLGVPTEKYQLISHEDVFNAVKSLEEYKIVKAELYKWGSTLVIEIEHKDVNSRKIEVLPKDFIIPRVRIFNSYDSSRGLQVQSFGLRIVCSNGMVAPVGTKYVSSNIHLGNSIDLEQLKKNIAKGMNIWNLAKGPIQKANKTKVPSEVALHYIGRFPKKYQRIAMQNLNKQDTVYNIWNELTRIVTHDMPKINTNVRIAHQRRVNQVFNFNRMTDKEILKLEEELKEYKKKEIKK